MGVIDEDCEEEFESSEAPFNFLDTSLSMAAFIPLSQSSARFVASPLLTQSTNHTALLIFPVVCFL